MARFNEVLNARYNRYLQKLFGMKGGPPTAQLSSEIMPVFPFFTGPENRFLEGWNRFATSAVILATAAVADQFQIRNPSNSKVIAILERLQITSSTTDNSAILTMNTGTPDLADFAAAPGTRCLDNRPVSGKPTTLGTAMRLSQGTGVVAPTGASIYRWNSLVASPPQEVIPHFEAELPLLPGDAYTFFGNTVNTTVVVNILWRERTMEESETQ